MALKTQPGTDAVDDVAPMPEPQYKMVVTVGDSCNSVVVHPLPQTYSAGTCRCGGCLAARLAARSFDFY